MTARFEDRDFTLPAYGRLCATLREAGYAGLTFRAYLETQPAARPERFVLLRHDVESSARRAVEMGAIEKAQGLAATYFFRTKPSVFRPQAIRELLAQGHEIGYHYETLGRAFGRIDAALALFEQDLARLRAHADVRVASMHGAPLSPWDNRDIWKKAQPKDFGLIGEVYKDVDYRDVAYFSDTGRTWHPHRYNIRDHAAVPPASIVDTTEELAELVRGQQLRRLCLLVHPDRWSATPGEWSRRALRDEVENRIKMVVKAVYDLLRSAPGKADG